jgi:hypothetical protein
MRIRAVALGAGDSGRVVGDRPARAAAAKASAVGVSDALGAPVIETILAAERSSGGDDGVCAGAWLTLAQRAGAPTPTASRAAEPSGLAGERVKLNPERRVPELRPA